MIDTTSHMLNHERTASVNQIIANNNSQGPTRVTVKAGEYLQVTGCDFTKA